MKIEGIGEFTLEDDGYYCCDRVPVRMLHDADCRIVIDGYDGDRAPQDFHDAVTAFLTADDSALQAATPYLFQYYRDCNSIWEAGDPQYLEISAPEEVWAHVEFVGEVVFMRRQHGERGVYAMLGGGCTWEREHGVQIVLQNGTQLCRVSAFDGHLTNADAFADPRLADVIYKRT